MSCNLNQYNEDLKLASFTFNKFFKSYDYLRDDLIQHAVYFLIKNKSKYNSNCKYTTFAVLVCKQSMLNYLQKYNKLANNNENLSLDFDYDDCSFIDILPCDDNVEDKLHFEVLLKLCRDEVLKNKSETFRKINLLYLNFVEPSDIQKKLGLTRQCVNFYIHKFHNLMREKYSNIII